MPFFCKNISLNKNTFIKSLALRLLLGPLAFFSSSLAIASDMAPGSLSLQQAVSLALQNNPLLLAEDARLDEALANSAQSNGMLMPRLNAASGVSRSNSSMSSFAGKLLQQRVTSADFAPAVLNNPSYLNNYHNRLTLEAPVYQGGRAWAAKDRAEQTEQATRHQVALARQQTIFAVVLAYTNVLRLQSREDAAQSAVNAAESHLRQTAALLDRGIGIQSDILDAQAHLSDTRLGLTQTRNARLRAMDELNRQLGNGQPSTMLVNAQSAPAIHLQGMNETMDADAIIAGHPRIAALERQLDAARAGISEASAGLRPNVSLLAAQEWNSQTASPRNPNTSIGAEVSINLFAGGSDMAARHAAQARFAHLQYQLQDERQALRDALLDAWRQLHEADEAAAARRDTLRQTAESLRIQKLRFEQGLEKSTDVLDAHTRNDRAVANDIDARFNLTVSRAALLLAAGHLTPEVLNAAQ
ncbi:MAG: hypothetical protein COS82_08845 [Zetaproteobacteria bacterium CG06_land_8_20_14_3_00_59_53]|nr:MAG: hypothetical protein AUK36_04270 [Zetaproteobacteria bacterium CG2_30_59_37]PIO89813.1 MAG: hypothetical protein COX56_05330 [Zetaproteobacteria bacterium CG23_combo_of_CG06-09_8_20_14_all_59_86]PIQ64176.1 MAG: hypothetical protein COV97_09580 [Zetaproteobacteria bacterium CG11_big_fil_rev_8_21_14_0_20_59_439]PIU69945.1 MAG: hypothetical protein COS82_08845 [Zetaproteobacteria bacterium CG06_land_8_20_14_3_00_59_53]PIU96003.1 MAG: hypothetical protein COS62_11105 [Zetaproteobacteria bac